MLYAAMGAATVPPASDPAFDPSAFVFTIRVENDGDSFTWPHRTGGVYDATFDWGDGSSDHVTTAPSAHVYASAGDYNVAVTGTCPAPANNTASWRNGLIEVKQWGQLIGATNWNAAFTNTGGFVVSATDVFGAGVTDMESMFYASGFTGDLSNWDVSDCTRMSGMFYGASNFDSDLSGWCVQHFDSEPFWFALDSALQPQHFPVWGTCP